MRKDSRVSENLEDKTDVTSEEDWEAAEQKKRDAERERRLRQLRLEASRVEDFEKPVIQNPEEKLLAQTNSDPQIQESEPAGHDEDRQSEQVEEALKAGLQNLKKDEDETKDIINSRRKRSAQKIQIVPSGKDKKYDMFEEPESCGESDSEDPGEDGRIIVRRDMDFDDDDHYYRAQVGEILEKNFRVTEDIGRGVYGSVVKAEDLTSAKEYAIKILRNADLLTKSGERESAIIKKLNEADPFDKKHVIRTGGTFQHRKHLCLVLELLDMNPVML